MTGSSGWRRYGLSGAAALAVLVLGWGIYWMLDNQRLDADALGTVGALATAAFTAIASIAALKAARYSRDTARDSVEALGLAMEPTLSAHLARGGQGSGPDEHRVVVENQSRWMASDVYVEVKTKDGRTGSHRFETIDPASQPNPTIEALPRAEYFLIVEPLSFPPEDDQDWSGQWDGYDEIVLTYSDGRRMLRWRKTCRYVHSYNSNSESRSSSSWYIEELERVR